MRQRLRVTVAPVRLRGTSCTCGGWLLAVSPQNTSVGLGRREREARNSSDRAGCRALLRLLRGSTVHGRVRLP